MYFGTLVKDNNGNIFTSIYCIDIFLNYDFNDCFFCVLVIYFSLIKMNYKLAVN